MESDAREKEEILNKELDVTKQDCSEAKKKVNKLEQANAELIRCNSDVEFELSRLEKNNSELLENSSKINMDVERLQQVQRDMLQCVTRAKVCIL